MSQICSVLYRVSELLQFCSPTTWISSSSKGESKKVVVARSTWKALYRCRLHIPPITISMAILILNIRGTYIGADMSGPIRSETITLMGFQLIAKMHELLIIASLGLIILHIVRHELIFGSGLPLGLIGSGLSFGSVIFFFTKEFWGAATYVKRPGHRLRRLGFLTLLLVAGALAAFAGPSSATLLVPKAQVWPSGGTNFYLNATVDQLWPDQLSGDSADLRQHCTAESSANSAICPAGGYASLREHWGRMNFTNFYHRDVPSYAKKLSGSEFYWPVHSPASAVPPMYALGNSRIDQDLDSNTFLVQPHAAAVTILQQIASDWWKALTSRIGTADDLIDDRNVRAHVPSAITSVRCSGPQNLSESDNRVRFPSIDGRFTYSDHLEFTILNLNSTPVDHLRFSWVHLPDEFGTVSIGGLFESPWKAGSRVVLGCSAQSGWVPTTVSTDEYTFWTGWYTWGIDFGGRAPAWSATPVGMNLSRTNGRIALSTEWLQLLSPPAPEIARPEVDWEPSTIEEIFATAGLAEIDTTSELTATEIWNQQDVSGTGRTPFIEAIISSILVDGISRTGSSYAFNTEGPSSSWPISSYEPLPNFDGLLLAGKPALKQPEVPASDFTTLHVEMEITGFAFRVSLAGYLSMAVLGTHILMAVVHTIWILVYGQTSASWNSVSELIALSQNSEPAPISLANTGGGIERSKTYAQIARIRVKCSDKESPDDEQVQLAFDQMKLRAPRTWPHRPLGSDISLEPHGRSASRERFLAPELRDRRDFTRLRVNHAYS